MARGNRADSGLLALRIYAVDVDPAGRLTKEFVARICADGTVEGEGPFVDVLRRQLKGPADLFRLARLYSNGYFAAELEGTKIYLRPGEEPPPGVQVHEGPRGGRYYYSGGRRRAEAPLSLPRLRAEMGRWQALFEDMARQIGGDSDVRNVAVRSAMKSHVVRRLARRSGLPERLVNDMVATWAQSSSDHRPMSLALQMATARIFGLSPTQFVEESWQRVCRGQEAACRTLLDAATLFVRAVYDETQEFLARRGIEYVPVVRGMALTDPPEDMVPLAPQEEIDRVTEWLRARRRRLGQVRKRWLMRHGADADARREFDRRWDAAVRRLETMAERRLLQLTGVEAEGTFHMNPLSSWTVRPDVAVQFATAKFGAPATFWALVPRRDVFALPWTGPGCLSEYETVVVGRPLRMRWRAVGMFGLEKSTLDTWLSGREV